MNNIAKFAVGIVASFVAAVVGNLIAHPAQASAAQQFADLFPPIQNSAGADQV